MDVEADGEPAKKKQKGKGKKKISMAIYWCNHVICDTDTLYG